MSQTNEKFLEVNNLVVEYITGKQVVHAVNGVSFSLDKGHTLGLVGETGAGKTSIAKSIIGVLSDPPGKVRSGEILLEGKDLLTAPEEDMLQIRGKRISMIFQDPMTALNPVMTIGDQIAEVVALHSESGNTHEAKETALEMLKMVGITPERYDDFPHQFSGGMKQRVVIAIALACNPELLLADEPTTALDVTIQAQVLEMINDLKEKLNTSMILITHDLGVVAEMCDDVAVVYAGEIIEQGSKEDLFDHPAHPYTHGLFGSLPSMAKGQKRLHPIPGLTPDPTDLPKGGNFSPRGPYATDAGRQGDIPRTELTPGHTCRCCNLGHLEKKEG
ncbi:MAG: ABC transporter ATP-binding protein [Clostridiales bacterium]|nr:ABC transporter ATP-binding protein [Clostridiales bacterium]